MIEKFGQLANGETVQQVEISNGGMTATVLSYGATLQSLRLDGHAPSLVIGFDELKTYVDYPLCFGAIAGRVANRIANATFELDGKTYHTDKNCAGGHTLHGGSKGTSVRNWKIVSSDQNSVTLEILDVEQHTGFPGDCLIRCTYRLLENATLEVELTATATQATQATVCNLAHHSYFILDGGTSILGHELQINAETYLPVNSELMPSGEELPVAGTPFDFRQLRAIGNGASKDIDNNYCLTAQKSDFDGEQLPEIAVVKSPQSGVTMRISSTEPGVQLYTSITLDVPLADTNGNIPTVNSGVCLEPQIWPDAMHHANFPSAVLPAGEEYHQISRFQFSQE